MAINRSVMSVRNFWGDRYYPLIHGRELADGEEYYSGYKIE